MSSDKLRELGEILKNSPKGSEKYKKAMKELDKILAMPEELPHEGDQLEDDGTD